MPACTCVQVCVVCVCVCVCMYVWVCGYVRGTGAGGRSHTNVIVIKHACSDTEIDLHADSL